MKFKDISELLGITEENCKKRSQRILKRYDYIIRKVRKVDNTVKIVLKEVCELSLMNDIQKMEELDFNDIIYEVLSTEQINKLVKKIDLLPFEYKNILFFRYYFNSTPSETDKILKIEKL